MIAVLFGLGLALAAPVDVERAIVALEEGDAARALTHLRVALAEQPDDVEALAAYVEALEAGGLGALVLVEVAALGYDDPNLRARDDTLRRLVREGDARGATREADALRMEHPDRPDLLLPLFDADPPIRRAQRAAVRAAEGLVQRSADAATLYRARRVLVRAGERDAAARAVEALVRVGEPRALARMPWGPAMRAGTARSLSMHRTPELLDGPPDEVSDIALRLTRALRDMGRVQEAIAVFEAARARHDRIDLALAHGEQLLRMRRVKEALAVAEAARALALAPTPADVGRHDARAWRAEIAAAAQLEATALAALERPEEALEAATTAALLVPSADAWRLVGLLHLELLHPEAAFAAFATARMLGASVDARLRQSWSGLADPLEAADALAPTLAAGLGVEGLEPAEVVVARGPRMGSPAPPEAAAELAAALERDSLAGHVVVLTFWASWCAPCRLELPELSKLARAHASDPVVFLAVSTDDRARDYERFVGQVDLEGMVVRHDPAIGATWRVRALPSTWILDGEGVIRHFQEGYGPGAEAVIARKIRASLEP